MPKCRLTSGTRTAIKALRNVDKVGTAQQAGRAYLKSQGFRESRAQVFISKGDADGAWKAV